MPNFDKSPGPLVERFAAVIGERDDVERRQMFGYPCAFVGGNLVTGLHQATWFVRLPPETSDELRALGGGSFEPMPGRPMTGYTLMPASIVDDDASVRQWVDRSVAFGRTLPPKAAKASKASKAR